MTRERRSNDSFERNQSTLPDQRTPRLEYYQTANDTLLVPEPDGPDGAWIEIDPNRGRV